MTGERAKRKREGGRVLFSPLPEEARKKHGVVRADLFFSYFWIDYYIRMLKICEGQRENGQLILP